MADHGYKPFFSERTAEFIKNLRPRGAATVQLVQDPKPLVQLRRMDPNAGRFTDHGDPVELIRVSFPSRSSMNTDGQNAGVVTQSAIGELKAFAPIDLQVDDRFDWGGQVCQVTHVYPVRNKQVRAVVELVPGGTGVRP